MVMQTLEQPPISMSAPFVVQQADLDLFDSLDDLLAPAGAAVAGAAGLLTSCSTLLEDSLNLDGLEHSASTGSTSSGSRCGSKRGAAGSRRSSIASSSSSNSSVCSKSFGWTDGDESIVSCESLSLAGARSKSPQHLRKSSTSKRRSSATGTPGSIGSRRSSSGVSTARTSTTGIERVRSHNNNSHIHTSPTGSKKKKKSLKKQHRRVSFTPRVTVRSIPDLDDFSAEERSELWYTELELQTIKATAHSLIAKAKTQKQIKRRSSWVMALSCVLDEQRRQRREHILPEKGTELLSKLYHSFAFSAVQIAISVAKDDAQAAI